MNGPAPPAIELAGTGKRYRIAERSLVRALTPGRRHRVRELWAVRDVDLDVQPGETVGVLGRNGAGKSTLLRMMAGVSEPTTGQVTVRGRIAPLISVGVGFDQELTGRENVFVNGMLLGLSRDQIRARFDEIVAFAELEDSIDTPVKFYSSGMFMRLGFSVAIHVDPDVLLVDEVLAVGDVAFQLKCFDRMRALGERGATIVLVSHSMHAIQLLCPRTLLFDHGELVFDGDTAGAIEAHHRLLGDDQPGRTPAAEQVPTGEVTVAARLLDGERETAYADQDRELHLDATLAFTSAQDSPQLVFRVVGEDGSIVYQFRTPVGHQHRRFGAGEQARARVRFRPALGGGGTFRIQLTVTDRDGRRALGRSDPAPVLYVPTRLGVIGMADLAAEASLDGDVLAHRPIRLGDGQPRSSPPNQSSSGA